MWKQHKSNITLTSIVIVFLILAAGIGIASFSYYAQQKKLVKQQNCNQLSAIAELKVNAIARWRGERLADALEDMNTPFIGRLILQYFENPEDPELRQQISGWLSALKANYDCYSVELLDAAGINRLSIPVEEPLDDHLLKVVFDAKNAGEPFLGDLHRTETEAAHLHLGIPLFTEKADKQAAGTILIRLDPYQFLFPLIQSWPGTSVTAETLLVRREGNEVLFLSGLRHRKDTALSMRLPMSDPRVPAVRAAQGLEGVFEGIDYRGSFVLSVIRRVPGTSWSLIAKIDTDEVYADLRQHALLIAFLVASMFVGAALTLGLILTHQRSQTLKEAHDSLERRVEERTADLRETNRRLQQEAEVRRRAEEEVRAVTARLADAEESERQRLARELHDSVGQSLAALDFNLRTIRNLVSAGSNSEVMTRLEDSQDMVKETVTNMRGVMADLRPPLLDDHGLAAVLRWHCREFSERSGIAAVVECDEQTPRLPPPAEIALFRIVQEALTNVLKHARAGQVTVTLEATGEAVHLTIADDGVGFNPEDIISQGSEQRSRWGMLSMRERAEMIGGRMRVQAGPGGGTRIVVEVSR